MKEYQSTTNSRVFRLLHRERVTSCSYCPPNRGENIKRKSLAGKKHKVKKQFMLDGKRWHKARKRGWVKN